MAMTTGETAERRGLWLSIVGALGMAALGIGFAVLTSSDAVLLDGLFSLIGFAIGLVTLQVAKLVRRPDDEIYHFGYAAYEPVLNLSKGLLMAFVSIFALVSAVMVAMAGGRTIEVGWAVLYAGVAAVGCFTIAVSQRRLARRTGSPLLEVDYKNWFIDGLLSVAVGIAFVIALFLRDSRHAALLPYVDPAVVIILVALSLPIPAKIIRDNWHQLLGRAPDETLQRRAREAVTEAFGGGKACDPRIRMQQIGRFTYLQIYVLCADDTAADVERMDACRRSVHDALVGEFDNLALDVVFTRDPRWVAVAIGKN
jgi:cation diffusion facilitator family transporter